MGADGAGALLETPWVNLLGAKIAFWYGLAMQSGAVVIGGSLAAWRWRVVRRRVGSRFEGGSPAC